MLDCAYCERPLICDACGAEFVPSDAGTYQALSQPDYVVCCSSCGELLVCKWCKTPYDGRQVGDAMDQ